MTMRICLLLTGEVYGSMFMWNDVNETELNCINPCIRLVPMIYGLLESKCPFTLWNLTPEKVCSDPRFYCHIVNGKPELKRDHLFQDHLCWAGLKWCCLQYSWRKKRLVTFYLILAVFYLLLLVLKFQSSEILVSDSGVSCVAQHHLAQHTPHSCGVYHIWFPSNQIPVQIYLILDLRDNVRLMYRAFKHRSRGGCTFSKATDYC